MKKLYTTILFAGLLFGTSVKAQVTYNDVAEIFYESCATCHHAGGIAPFSLLNFSETSAFSSSIDNALRTGSMPPWQVDTTYTRHLNEEIITEANKNLILQWVTDGSVEGDPNLLPPAPLFDDTGYELCPEPDMILKMDPYTLEHDEGYDCFMLATNLTTDRYLRAYEIVPGNREIVHHIVIGVGQQGMLTGTTTSGACLQTGGLEMGTFVPNAAPTVYPDKAPLRCGMLFKANDYLNLQIHYAPGCLGKSDSTEVRLYFYPEGATNVREVHTTVDIDLFTLNIPANQVTTINGSVNVGQDRTVLGVFPHSHLIAKAIHIRGVSGGQPDIPLIRINDWEFNWAGYFYYKQLIKLPAGYTISADHTYDNTASNPNQFNNPPQNISWSTSTTGEMLYDAFQWMDYETGDENIDMEALLACDTLFVCRPKPADPITGTATFCGTQTGLAYSAPAIIGAETYSWSYSGTGATITGTGNSVTIDFSGSATSGDLTVEGVNECGVSGKVSDAYSIVISGGGSVDAAGTITGTASICEGETGVAYSVPAIANATTYGWSYSGTGATITGTSESVTIDFSASATSGDLTVQGESACGNGTVSATYAIMVNASPSVPTITASSSCGSTDLTSSTSTAGYLWSPGGATTQSITVSTDGTYSVTVGSGTCSATSAAEVVTIIVTPSITSTQDGIRCDAGDVVLEATASAGDPSWYADVTGGPALATATSYTASTSATTTYYVDATDNGCTTATRTAVIATISNGPTAAISGDATVCSGANGTLTIALTGTSPWSFTYGSVAGSNPVSGITTASYTVAATAGTYTVSTVSDAGGCSGTTSGAATITESTDITVSNITKTCNGGGTGYTVEFDIAGGDAGSYAITGDGGTLTTTTHYTSSEITSGTQSTFNVTDAADCNPVQVSEQKTCGCAAEGTISGGGTICTGSEATITIDLVGTSPWSITYAIEGADQTPVTGITASPYTFTTTVAGDYTLSSVSDANCTGSTSGTATVSETSPTATISGGGAVCDDGSTTSITFELTGGSPPWSFTYSDGTTTSALITSNFTTTSEQVSAAGTYSIVSMSAGACSGTGTGSADVTVNSLPTIGATASPSATVCSGESVTLNGTGGDTYVWSDGKTDGLAFATTATATYTVTGTDSNGCSNTSTQSVTVNEAPTITPNATPSSAAVCIGQSVTLSGAATGITSFTWTGGVIDGQAFIPAVTTTYTVSGSDAGGCTGTAVRTVSVFTLPTVGVTVTPSATVCEGESVTLSGTGADSYSWSGGVVDGTAFIPTATATYTVTGSDAFSCENTATQEVVVETCNNTGVGIAEASASTQRALIYPNPSSGVLFITIKDATFSDITITIENMLGSNVFTASDINNAVDYTVELNVKDLQEGVYNLTISTDAATTVHKLVIQ